MKKIFNISNAIFYFPGLIIFLVSFHSYGQAGDQEELRSRMEQRAIITATVFQDKDILNSFVNTINEKLRANEQNDEAITFDEIASGNPSYVSGFASLFKASYMQIFNSGKYYNAAKYAGLSPGNPSQRIDNSFSTKENEQFYYNDRAQIYFPYSENFPGSQVSSVYVTFNPGEDLESNTGYYVNSRNEMQTTTIDEDYAMNNPSLVINFEESENTPLPDLTGQPNGISSCEFLKDNVIADIYDDNYVITVTMPKIKLLKNFRTILGGSNYLTIYVFYAKPNFDPGTDVLSAIPITAVNRLVCYDYQIRRRDRGKWINFGQIFNDDWRLIQFDNPFYAWKKTGWFKDIKGAIDADITGGVKCTWDPVKQKCIWSVSFEAGFKASIHFDIQAHHQVLGSDYPTRRGTLANALGNNFGNGTALDAGEDQPWAVRKLSDAFLYYYKIRVCH